MDDRCFDAFARSVAGQQSRRAVARTVAGTLLGALAAATGIGGADAAFQGRGAGAAVFLGTLEALRDSGVRRAQSKLSATNTAMMNLTAYAGCRFSNPEHVYHWHAPQARYLVDPGSISR